MRKDIKIELVEAPGHPGQLTAFKIRYSAGTPQLAQQVNSELTSLFIDENLKSQQQLSESTTAFLQSQLADARAKLEEQEAKGPSIQGETFRKFAHPGGNERSNPDWLAELNCKIPSGP